MEKSQLILQIMTEGNRAMERGDFQAAEMKFLIAVEMGSIGALFNLGLLERKTGNTLRSIMYFLDAALRNDPDAVMEIGQIYEALGEMEKAKGWYERAAELGSKSAIWTLDYLESDPDFLEKYDDEEEDV
jgi:TPR repeat protein